MFNATQLMRLHVEALFTCDAAGRLLASNQPDPVAAPRLFLGRTVEGNAWWLRHDAGPALAAELEALCEGLPVSDDLGEASSILEPLLACLALREPITKTWTGPAFHFPAELPRYDNVVQVTHANATVLCPCLEDWLADVSAGVPMVVALEDGKAVSVCASVRVTAVAHEAGVETHPDFRERGHGAQAAAAWATVVRESGRVPLYSTSWSNEASRRLATRLGLVQFGSDLHFRPVG